MDVSVLFCSFVLLRNSWSVIDFVGFTFLHWFLFCFKKMMKCSVLFWKEICFDKIQIAENCAALKRVKLYIDFRKSF